MISFFQKKLRSFFGCSRTEANGLIILLLLTLVAGIIPSILKLNTTQLSNVISNEKDIALLEDLFQQLEKQTEQSHQHFTFDINKASKEQLMQVKGIGPTLAIRIINYQKKLGGFVDKAQYKEIYGLTKTAIKNLIKSSYIAPEFIPKQLSINQCNIQSLSKHPYMPYRLAHKIIEYRIKHGPFQSLDTLLSQKLLTIELLKKLHPYVTINTTNKS